MPCRSRSIRQYGLVYASTWDIPRIQKIAAPKPQVLGADSTGVTAAYLTGSQVKSSATSSHSTR